MCNDSFGAPAGGNNKVTSVTSAFPEDSAGRGRAGATIRQPIAGMGATASKAIVIMHAFAKHLRA